MTDMSIQNVTEENGPLSSRTDNLVGGGLRTPFWSGPKSIRSRLQWWYGAVYAISIIVFGSLVYWRADRDVHERATLQAVSAAQYLDVSLRNFRPEGNRESGEMHLPGLGGRDPFPPAFHFGPFPPDFQFRPPRDREPGGRPPGRLPPAGPDGPGRPPQSDRSPQPGRSDGPDRTPPPGRPDGPDRAVPQRGPGGPMRPAHRDFLESLNPPELELPDREGFNRPPIDRLEFIIWRRGGDVLTRSDGEAADDYAVSPAPVAASTVPRVTRNKGTIETLMRGPHGTTILVLRTLRHDIDSLHQFGFQIAGIAGGTLLVGLAGGWWISGRLVQPIQRIAKTASQISATNLHQRIEVHRLDQELIQLAVVLNQTFERLERSFGRLTQFTADASHELRTPLAVIQSQIELALSQPRAADMYQQTLATCLSSSERMRSLIDGLLLLARTDANHSELRREQLDLRRVAEDAVAQRFDKAISSEVDLQCSTSEEAVMVSGDSRFLAQVAGNLIDNALQHTPPGGTVLVNARVEDHEALLSVSDTGCGIAEEHLPHVFDRFYRVDVSRSRRHGGSGLGLAICKSLVESHGGRISCESTCASGSVFVVRLPLPESLRPTNTDDGKS